MEKISYKLEVFEGPLDVLLFLISKHKLSIEDIPIRLLIEQYLEYMKQMKNINLDVTSDFVDMAARLIYIKTASLLPVHDEADQLVAELRGELIEYQDCKKIAEELSTKANGFGFLNREPQEFEPDMQYSRIHELSELYKAYISAVGRGKRKLPPPVEAFSGIIAHKIVSVASKISGIMDKFKKKKSHKYSSFFDNSESKSDMVAIFLALLMLVKAKRLTIEGSGKDTRIVYQNSVGVIDDIES